MVERLTGINLIKPIPSAVRVASFSIILLLPLSLISTIIQLGAEEKYTGIYLYHQYPSELKEMSHFFPKSEFPRHSSRSSSTASMNSTHLPTSQEENLVGFYNVFRNDRRHFKGIITEQIHHLESSGLALASQAINVVFAGTYHRSFRVPTR